MALFPMLLQAPPQTTGLPRGEYARIVNDTPINVGDIFQFKKRVAQDILTVNFRVKEIIEQHYSAGNWENIKCKNKPIHYTLKMCIC